MRSMEQLQQIGYEEAMQWHADIVLHRRRGVWKYGVPSWFEEVCHAVPEGAPALVLTVVVPPIIMDALARELEQVGSVSDLEEKLEEAEDNGRKSGYEDGYQVGYDDGEYEARGECNCDCSACFHCDC